LTHSGRLTHEVVTRQPWIRRRSGKVRQLQTDVLTTEPRRQPVCCCVHITNTCRVCRDVRVASCWTDSAQHVASLHDLF